MNDQDTRPHSRACGIKNHDHGRDCHTNCPTCKGVVDQQLTFESASISTAGMYVHFTRCWSCIIGQHQGGDHPWADAEDIAHALKEGQQSPEGQTCACDCISQPPVVIAADDYLDADPTLSIDESPCVVCDELGACGYDVEGRPYIHAAWLDNADEENER